jgi:hypothetical protein
MGWRLRLVSFDDREEKANSALFFTEGETFGEYPRVDGYRHSRIFSSGTGRFAIPDIALRVAAVRLFLSCGGARSAVSALDSAGWFSARSPDKCSSRRKEFSARA